MRASERGPQSLPTGGVKRDMAFSIEGSEAIRKTLERPIPIHEKIFPGAFRGRNLFPVVRLL